MFCGLIQIVLLLVDDFTRNMELVYMSFSKEIKTLLAKMVAELLSDLCMGEIYIFLYVDNDCVTQQFDV